MPARTSALPAASRAMASVPAACWRSKYASETARSGVVGRDLDAGLVRGDDPPPTGLVDRVGDPQDPAQAVQGGVAGSRRRGGEAVGQGGRRAERQRVAVDRLDLAVDRLDLAVEAIIGRPGEEAGQPEPAGLLQVGQGPQDLLPGGGDVQVATARQAQGVGQVDRLDDLARTRGAASFGGRHVADSGRWHALPDGGGQRWCHDRRPRF